MKDSSFYKGREQTYLKHFVLENYLEKLSWKIGYTWGNLCYVDGFSGPWKATTDDYGDTSIKISLGRLSKTRQDLLSLGKRANFKCIFVEKEEKPFKELKNILKESPGTGIEAVPLHGQFEDLIDEVLRECRNYFTLFFIDPSGWTGYRLTHIGPIVCRPNSEFLINFMFTFINRMLTTARTESDICYFDDFFCDSGAWREVVVEGDGREDSILAHYIACLKKRGGYPYTTNTRILKPAEDRTYFHLIHATRHPEGLRTFKKIDEEMQYVQRRVRKDALHERKYRKTGQRTMFGSQYEDTETIYIGHRLNAVAQLGALWKEMLAENERFLYEEFELNALQIEMIYTNDIADLVLQAKKLGYIDVPNWKDRQRKPRKNTIIERKGSQIIVPPMEI